MTTAAIASRSAITSFTPLHGPPLLDPAHVMSGFTSGSIAHAIIASTTLNANSGFEELGDGGV